ALVSTAAAIQFRDDRNKILAEQGRTERAEKERKTALVSALLTAAPDKVPAMLDSLSSISDLALPMLKPQFEDENAPPARRLRAAIGLTVLGEPQTDYLMSAIAEGHASECRNLALAFRAIKSPTIGDQLLDRIHTTKDPVRQARYAILGLDLG